MENEKFKMENVGASGERIFLAKAMRIQDRRVGKGEFHP
jgi:hypothetical protein